ncbi:carbamoyltransferase family protein [Xanthomonas albilineans]|uniref:Putative carbamoyl transferase n=2 Tax=Xanthomonas albilineans TaxID=29447 RepID=Q70C42_XANAL|nr:carbamoyltransferase C-terminal domain-containing protein [Xanthomonas albilineans]CAE52324.1 putative carbamoyl transferase [Xanthomonas albilineans]
MKRTYIGLANSFHDSAIAIVGDDGQVRFAEATERYLQYKRSIGVAPDVFQRAIKLVHEYGDPGAELVVATSWSGQTPELMREGLGKTAQAVDQYRSAFGDLPWHVNKQFVAQSFFYRSQLAMVEHPGHLLEYDLSHMAEPAFKPPSYRHYEHHLTHAVAGCYTSPFEEAVCAVLDGMGEKNALACYHYQQGKLTPIHQSETSSWASLGFFYGMICEVCGFGTLSGEEWKVMGLAAYGQHDRQLYELLRQMLRVDGLTLRFAPAAQFSQLQRTLYAMRRCKGQPTIELANLAYAGQQVFCDVLFEFLHNLHALGLSDHLVLGGGCALNSSANGRVLAETPFRHLHVFAAPGDDGNAVGAALWAHAEDHPEQTPPAAREQSPYLGSSMSAETLHNVERFGALSKFTRCLDDAAQRAARLLTEGKIVAWVQGRAEFGPRALGNRSILADPRSPAIKDIINARVKFREEFRPFAPSILHEHGAEYFELYQESPYMERTLKFRAEATRKVPGVVHHDGTGRLQTVKQHWNPRYHALIKEFYRLTGIPLVLNTSFNVMGKPIAHSVEDALSIFFTSGLDAMFIDDVLIEK